MFNDVRKVCFCSHLMLAALIGCTSITDPDENMLPDESETDILLRDFELVDGVPKLVPDLCATYFWYV